MLPMARQQNLSVKEMAEETLVYDLEHKKVHSLNRTAALVWKHCDGQTSVAQLAARLQKALSIPKALEVAQLALEQLSRRNLLEQPIQPLSPEARLSRREVLKDLGKKLAVAAIALPVIMTVAAPKARAQASPCLVRFLNGNVIGQDCKNGRQCQTGNFTALGFTGVLPGICY
jgi:hypothetical protein